jgi:hypothetical protein
MPHSLLSGIQRVSDKDSFSKVIEMNEKLISQEVDSWIAEEELPQHPFLKPIRQFDGLYPEDEEERQAYFDFIAWAMNIEYEILNSIPLDKSRYNRFFIQLDGDGCDISPFNTIDYLRDHPFDKYHYRLKKIFEKAKDLAETHSCLSNKEGKINISNRFVNLVTTEFIEKANKLKQSYLNNSTGYNKETVLERIRELNKNTRICKEIWKKHAFSQ